MPQPLVSCLTPTCNRRTFFPDAIKCFLAYDYAPLEWIILDDGTDPVMDLLPDDPRIRYFHELPKRNHGDKMNRCCELARGEFGIVADDDDRYPPDRVSRQIAPFLADPVLEVTGTSTLYYYERGTEKAYRYTSPNTGWLASIAFRRSAWDQHKFASLKAGADFEFQKKAKCFDLCDPRLVVASIHPDNACKKNLGSEYKSVEWSEVKRLAGEDL